MTQHQMTHGDSDSRETLSRNTLLGGFVIALIGTAALVSEIWPESDRYLPAVIGAGLLIVFAFTRAYLALVAGSIATGLGVGLIGAELFFRGNPEVDGAAAVLGLAAGFIGVWVVQTLMRLGEAHWWPLIPGSILLLVGIGLTADIAGATLAPWVVPAAVLVIGALIMAAGYLLSRPRRA